MHRSVLSGVFSLALVALATSACDKSTEAATPITPGPTEISEPDFTGTLAINGGVTQHFSVTTVGNVTAIVKSIEPNTEARTVSIGVALGTWNGTTCEIHKFEGLFNDNAGVGSGVAGQANAAGDLCVRVYDPGTLTEPVTFVVSITHF